MTVAHAIGGMWRGQLDALYVFYGRILTVQTMSKAAHPIIKPGRACRTRHLRRWSANPTRLAIRLVRDGRLRRAAHGLFYAPVASRFGVAPPPDTELLRAFLDDTAFVITGPARWNALGLGSTALFAATLVYNRKRTGEFTFDGRRFILRRVLFPDDPPPEWFVVDMVQHRDMAGVSQADLELRLVARVREGRWNRGRLRRMAGEYGTRATRAFIDHCIAGAGVAP